MGLAGSGASLGFLFPSLTEDASGGPPLRWLRSHSVPQTTAEKPYLVYPDEPFIVPEFGAQYFQQGEIGGWQSASTTERLRTVLGLHPDVLDYNPLAQFIDGELATPSSTEAQLQFSKRTGIPGTAGWNVTIKPEPDRALSRYGPLMREKDWRYPDGTSLENPRGILAERFDGEPHLIEFTFGTSGIPSVFAPGNLDLLVHVTEQRLEQGFAGFFVDGVGIFRFQGLDFSVWATEAFADHLVDLPDDRLAELGIDDPATFDIRSYLESANLTPADGNDPREDPVFREYLLHHHIGIRAFFRSYRQAVAARFPDRMDQEHIKLYGNQFMGNFGNPQSANVYVSDQFDLINTEIFPTVDPGVDFIYKLMEALGRFSKPSLAKGTLNALGGARKEELDPELSYRMLKRFQVAEAVANGAVFKPPLTTRSGYTVDESITNWIRGDGTVHDELQQFIDFVWAHRRFLNDVSSDADVAVVWSLPTRLWWHEPQWNIGESGSTRIDSFVGSTRLLREAQIPYDVVVFGHSRLWDDTEQLERLKQYDAVVLPGVQCLSRAQVTAIDEYIDGGGTVVTSGPAPDRSEMFERSDSVQSLFDRPEVTVLEDDPGRQRASEGTTDESLRQSLPVSSLTAGTDADIAVSTFTQPDALRTLVHLLNYDYDPGIDQFTAKETIPLEIPTPDHSVGVARYYSPQQITDVEFSITGGRAELAVPKLVEWGFVVLAPDRSALIAEEAKPSAESRLDEAKQELDLARETDRDWGPDWATAEVNLEAATTAFGYDAYTLAEQRAQKSLEAVEETYPRPTIGIDQAHNQLESLSQTNPFSWMMDRFSEYRYATLNNWEDGAFDDVDVLLVPPALAFRGESFEFTESELDRVERFVSTGGILVVMVRGGVAGDIDQLTERFGYRFHGQPIVFPDGESESVPPAVTHPLTADVDGVTASLATPIEERPGHATVLASVPEDSGAWYHRESPLEERSETEDSAAGVPIFVHGSYNNGHVVLLGTHRYLVSPEHTHNAMDVMGNLLSTTGREAVTGEPVLLDTVVAGQYPTDVDGDGAFEDITGDGEFDVVDVQTLFTSRNSPGIQNNAEAYDFNEDGSFSVADIQTLFTDLLR